MSDGPIRNRSEHGVELPIERLDDVLLKLLESADVLPSERISLEQQPAASLAGRVLAGPLHSAVDHPPSDVSAMDGWAVRSEDLKGASSSSPAALTCVGDSAAGASSATFKLAPSTCQRIATGAAVPFGADAVIPVEKSHLEDPRLGRSALARSPADLPSQVWFSSAPTEGAHIRRRGEDMRIGQVVAGAGSVIDPALLAVIYTSGNTEILCAARPRVAILTTGNELSTAAGSLQIRDSNGPALSALAQSEGAEVVSIDQVEDDARAISDAVDKVRATCDVLVTTGGVSVGAHDHVGAALEQHFNLLVWRVAIQPGKPLLIGERRAGDRGARFVLGVPGNPVSAFVIGVEVLAPLLRRMTGRAAFGLAVDGVLEEAVESPVGRRSFIRLAALRSPNGDLERDSSGRIRVRLAGGQGSHQTATLAECDALGIIPEEVGSLVKGATIRLRPLSRSFRRVVPSNG